MLGDCNSNDADDDDVDSTVAVVVVVVVVVVVAATNVVVGVLCSGGLRTILSSEARPPGSATCETGGVTALVISTLKNPRSSRAGPTRDSRLELGVGCSKVDPRGRSTVEMVVTLEIFDCRILRTAER